jgi:hypothetical protein
LELQVLEPALRDSRLNHCHRNHYFAQKVKILIQAEDCEVWLQAGWNPCQLNA